MCAGSTHLDFLHEGEGLCPVKVQTALATRRLLPHAHLQRSSLTSDQCLKSPSQQQNAADCHQQNAGHARKKQGLYFKNAAFIFAISKIPDKIHQDRHISHTTDFVLLHCSIIMERTATTSHFIQACDEGRLFDDPTQN